MKNASNTGVFDFVYTPAQQTARLTFSAFSDSRPDDQASYWFNGPYCMLRRSPREQVILKIRSQRIVEALRRAREVHVAETGNDKVVWSYRMTHRERT
ncbi:MAG: hypothetical protein PHY92_07010 [Alphaproteobacteria bacterium]|nr:hypothetical protein [Alphaproteobacteria bacterium]